MEGLISLKEILQQLVQEYAESPPTPCNYAEIPEKLTDGRRETVRLELLFELLLREQGLTAIRKQREGLILPDRGRSGENAPSEKNPEPHSIVRTAC